MQHADTFFSYSRDDSEFVLKLASGLREQGVNLWLDQLDIEAGERWDSAVEKALGSCHTLIVVLSPSSVASVNVMDEVSYALQSDKRVVPVLSRACAVPFRLRRVQHIDFVDDYDRGFKRLIQALSGAPGDAAVSPAVAPLDRLPARVEPAADRASGGPYRHPGKRLAVGIGVVAVLALVSFLVFQFVPRGTVNTPPEQVDPSAGSVGTGEILAVETDQTESKAGPVQVELTRANETDLALDVNWIDFQGVERFSGTIEPGDSRVAGTSNSGALFRVRIHDPQCAELNRVEVEVFQLVDAPKQTLKISPHMITSDMRQRAKSRLGC